MVSGPAWAGWPADWLPLLLMATVGLGVVLVGWRRGALTGGGAAASLAVGAVLLLAGGPAWAVVLIVVFASASSLSGLGRGQKAAREIAKGPRRDAVQVLANTGWGAMLAVLALWNTPEVLFAAFAGTMAAITADTWATEIGTLVGGSPRLITTGRPVPPGTSGAISLPGTAASALGGLLIGMLAGAAWATAAGGWTAGASSLPSAELARWAFLGLGAGLVGSLADSLLGATGQALYHCPACDKPTEQRRHRCGAECRLVKGWAWLDNDVVNAVASVAGSVAGLLLAAIL